MMVNAKPMGHVTKFGTAFLVYSGEFLDKLSTPFASRKLAQDHEKECKNDDDVVKVTIDVDLPKCTVRYYKRVRMPSLVAVPKSAAEKAFRRAHLILLANLKALKRKHAATNAVDDPKAMTIDEFVDACTDGLVRLRIYVENNDERPVYYLGYHFVDPCPFAVTKENMHHHLEFDVQSKDPRSPIFCIPPKARELVKDALDANAEIVKKLLPPNSQIVALENSKFNRVNVEVYHPFPHEIRFPAKFGIMDTDDLDKDDDKTAASAVSALAADAASALKKRKIDLTE